MSSERPDPKDLRELAREAPRSWSPPDWLRRVLTLDELSEINEDTPTCWVGMFLWWRAGGEEHGWQVKRACVRDAAKTGSCYCGRFRDPEEAREAMLRWSEKGKRDWQRGQHEGPDPCLRCHDNDRTGDYFCDECRPERQGVDLERR